MINENTQHLSGLNWKPSPISPEQYLVSDCGKCYSIKNKMIIKQRPNEKGYLWVIHKKNQLAKNIKIHRLVALAFLPNPDNLPEVNHIDMDKTNNHVSNLEWCTHKQNIAHALANRIFNRPTRKVLQFNMKGELIREWGSIKEAAASLNSNQSGLVKTLTEPHIRHSHKGYKWKYAA
jgi:hypothetical protein